MYYVMVHTLHSYLIFFLLWRHLQKDRFHIIKIYTCVAHGDRRDEKKNGDGNEQDDSLLSINNAS